MPTLRKPRKCKFSKDGTFRCSKSRCVVGRAFRARNPIPIIVRLLDNPAMCKYAVQYITITEILDPVYETINLTVRLEDSDANT